MISINVFSLRSAYNVSQDFLLQNGHNLDIHDCLSPFLWNFSELYRLFCAVIPLKFIYK